MSYAFMQISLEAFSMDTMEDVFQDGYRSFNANLIVDFDIGLYQFGKQGSDVKTYPNSVQTQKTYISRPIRVACYQIYDCWLNINTSSGLLSDTEQVK